jgi:hypothetical protein
MLRLCAFCILVMCMFLPFSSSDAIDDHQLEVQALHAEFCVVAHRWCRVTKEVFHL